MFYLLFPACGFTHSLNIKLSVLNSYFKRYVLRHTQSQFVNHTKNEGQGVQYVWTVQFLRLTNDRKYH